MLPDEDGRFDTQQLLATSVYCVNGEDLSPSSDKHPPTTSITSPFGAYCGPTSTIAPSISPKVPAKLAAHRKNQFRKTIALVSLSTTSDRPSSSKSTSSLDYSVVTQLVITLSTNNCSVAVVSDLTQQQVGFDVILLDSKCFPIMDTDTTSSVDFWKSNRRILAASKELYHKLTGSSTDPKHAKKELRKSIDLTRTANDYSDIEEPKSKRSPILRDDLNTKLNQVIEGIEEIKNNNEGIKAVGSLFECIICKDIM